MDGPEPSNLFAVQWQVIMKLSSPEKPNLQCSLLAQTVYFFCIPSPRGLLDPMQSNVEGKQRKKNKSWEKNEDTFKFPFFKKENKCLLRWALGRKQSFCSLPSTEHCCLSTRLLLCPCLSAVWMLWQITPKEMWLFSGKKNPSLYKHLPVWLTRL